MSETRTPTEEDHPYPPNPDLVYLPYEEPPAEFIVAFQNIRSVVPLFPKDFVLPIDLTEIDPALQNTGTICTVDPDLFALAYSLAESVDLPTAEEITHTKKYFVTFAGQIIFKIDPVEHMFGVTEEDYFRRISEAIGEAMVPRYTRYNSSGREIGISIEQVAQTIGFSVDSAYPFLMDTGIDPFTIDYDVVLRLLGRNILGHIDGKMNPHVGNHNDKFIIDMIPEAVRLLFSFARYCQSKKLPLDTSSLERYELLHTIPPYLTTEMIHDLFILRTGSFFDGLDRLVSVMIDSQKFPPQHDYSLLDEEEMALQDLFIGYRIHELLLIARKLAEYNRNVSELLNIINGEFPNDPIREAANIVNDFGTHNIWVTFDIDPVQILLFGLSGFVREPQVRYSTQHEREEAPIAKEITITMDSMDGMSIGDATNFMLGALRRAAPY